MQVNSTNLEKTHSETSVLPTDPIEKSAILSTLEKTASAVQIIFAEGLSKLTSLRKPIEENELQIEMSNIEAKVYDPDFLLAKKCSWAVKGYQKIFEKGVVSGSPGPGNGYFETIQHLFEQIDILAIKFGCRKEFDRTPYFAFLEDMFSGIPRLTRCCYPAILYFIAWRLTKQNNPSFEIGRHLDFWLVSKEPSKNLYTSALSLSENCNNMIDLLSSASEEDFEIYFREFENSWNDFYHHLKQESIEHYTNWFPDLNIHVIMMTLAKSRDYNLKVESILGLLKYFDDSPEDIFKSIERYPMQLSDTYINNRAYNIAFLVHELSSTTFDTFVGATIHEVKILEL